MKITSCHVIKSKGPCWINGQQQIPARNILILLQQQTFGHLNTFSSPKIPTMTTTATTFTPLSQPQFTTSHHHRNPSYPITRASLSGEVNSNLAPRRKIVTIFLAASASLLGANNVAPVALAENWGTRSFLRERYFEPGLSPEDAVARIRQTADGLHSIRNMLETMSWRYVLFYIRLKAAYLSQDMKNAMAMVPDSRKSSYVKAANELVDNMSEFDYYVRTPKVYESYLYYEKALKSMDELVALLA